MGFGEHLPHDLGTSVPDVEQPVCVDSDGQGSRLYLDNTRVRIHGGHVAQGTGDDRWRHLYVDW